MNFVFSRAQHPRGEDQIQLSAISNDFELSSDESDSDYGEIIDQESFGPQELEEPVVSTQPLTTGSLWERRNRSFLTCDTKFDQSEDINDPHSEEENVFEGDDVYPISSLSGSASPRPENYEEKYVGPEEATKSAHNGEMRVPPALNNTFLDYDSNHDPKSLPFYSWKLRRLQASPINRVSKLLQNQRTTFGMDMLQAIIDDNDRFEIEFLMENLGYSFEEAALYRFNAQRGLKLPDPGCFSSYRSHMIQCVRLSPQNNGEFALHPESVLSSQCDSRPDSRRGSRTGSRTASPAGSVRSVFSFSSFCQSEQNQLWSLANIEEAIEYFQKAHKEFFKGLTESHATSLTILLSQQEQSHGLNMFDSLDGFQYCHVRDCHLRGFPLDKAVWRVYLARFPEEINEPAAFFLRDASDVLPSVNVHMQAHQSRSHAHSSDVCTTGATQSSVSSFERSSPSSMIHLAPLYHESHFRDSQSASSSPRNYEPCASVGYLESDAMIAEPGKTLYASRSHNAISTTNNYHTRNTRPPIHISPLPLSPRTSPHSLQSRRQFFPNSAGEIHNGSSPTNYSQTRISPKAGTMFPPSINAISPTYLSSNNT